MAWSQYLKKLVCIYINSKESNNSRNTGNWNIILVNTSKNIISLLRASVANYSECFLSFFSYVLLKFIFTPFAEFSFVTDSIYSINCFFNMHIKTKELKCFSCMVMRFVQLRKCFQYRFLVKINIVITLSSIYITHVVIMKEFH